MKSQSMKPKEVALTLVFFVLMCGGVVGTRESAA